MIRTKAEIVVLATEVPSPPPAATKMASRQDARNAKMNK